MMRLSIRVSLSFLLGFLSFQAWAKQITLRHYQVHPRYEYGHKLLELALRAVGYEATLKPVRRAEDINEARGSLMLKNDQGIDYQFLSLNRERTENFIVIEDFPIYQGLLGTRLFLVKKGNKDLFRQVKSVDDLRRFTGLHGADWSDLSVFEGNQLPVMANPSYESLFKQLSLGRGDYFHRGVNEVWGEIDRWQDQLEIADHIALFYLHPSVYLLNKKNQILADLIREGLKKTKQDGSQDRLFLEYHGEMIRKAKLEDRNLIIVKNPANIGTRVSFDDPSSWMSSEQVKRIQDSELF